MQKGEVDWGDKGVKGFAKAQLKPHYQNSDPHPPANTKIKDMINPEILYSLGVELTSS